MDDVTVGRLQIKVMPDTKGFRDKLKAELAEIQKTAKIAVQVELDTTGLSEQLKAENARLKHSASPIEVPVKVDPKTIENDIKERIGSFHPPSIDIPVDLDTGKFTADLVGLREIAKHTGVTVPVKVDTKSAVRDAAVAARGIGKAFSSVGGIFSSLGKKASSAFKSVSGQIKATKKDVEQVGSLLSNIGQVASGATIAAVFAGAPAIVGAVTVALGALETALLAIPAALTAMGAAIGVAALAVQGLNGAIGAGWQGQSKKFKQDLKNLSPAAQTFAKAIVAVKKPLTQVQKIVQQNFFAPFASSIKGLITGYIPLLKTGLGSVATAMGKVSKSLVNALSSPATKTDLSVTFSNIAKAVTALAPAMKPLVHSFALLSAVGSQTFTPMAKAIGQVATQFDKWVTKASQTGELDSMFSNLGLLIKSLVGPLGTLAAGIAKAFADPSTTTSLKEMGSALGTFAKHLSANLPLYVKAFGQTMELLGPALDGAILGLDAISYAIQYVAFVFKSWIALGKGLVSFLKGPFVGGIKTVGNFFKGPFVNFFVGGFNKVVSKGRSWANSLQNAYNSVKRYASNAASNIRSATVGAFNSMVSSARNKMSSLLSTVRGIPGRAKSALGSLGGVLRNAGATLIQGFINGIKSKIGGVESTLHNLTNSLTSWKGPPSKDKTLLYKAGTLVIGGFIAGLESQYGDVKSSLAGLTTQMGGLAPALSADVSAAISGTAIVGDQTTVLKIDSETVAKATKKGSSRTTRRNGR